MFPSYLKIHESETGVEEEKAPFTFQLTLQVCLRFYHMAVKKTPISLLIFAQHAFCYYRPCTHRDWQK